MKHVSAHENSLRFFFFATFLLWGGLSHEAGAAPLGVGYRETLDLAVPEATTSNLTDRLSISEGTLNKSGAGTLAVAVSNLTVQGGGSIIVRNGSFQISSDTNTVMAPVPCPMDVMSNAAFWVDAATNVITVSSNGNAYADAWLDVRETNTVAPFRYTRAVANWAFSTNVSPQLVFNAGVSGTLPSIWFGCYATSLRTMTWTTPANATADITGIYHVFAIHGVLQSYGFIFGAMSGVPDFHISNYSSAVGSTNAAIWSPTEWTTTAVRQGRTYLDGDRIDGALVYPKPGWHLLEVALGTKTAHAANFFNDRGISSTQNAFRQGGDNLCEVAVFTNRLSESDRLRVQQYLMQKWLARKSVGAFAVSASASGTVVVDVATNSSQTVRLGGEGALRKQGAGTAVVEDVSSITNRFRSASIQGGVLDAHVPVPLALTAGSRVITSNTAITVSSNAGADQIIKEGTGSVTVTSLPQDLVRLTVSNGTLILTPPAVSNTVALQISGAISNATFEAEQLSSYRRGLANGETYYGWTAYFPAPTGAADNAVFVFNRSMASASENWACPYDAPEGKQVLALKQDASVSTTLSLPSDGIYDVSFYTSARSFLTGRHEFDLCIMDDATTNRVATVQTVNQAYTRQSFRLPWLAAGNHTLLFKRTVLGVDTLGTIDDVKATLVSETKPSTVSIFNGDFEVTEYSRTSTSFTTSNLAPGWTFTAATNNEVSAGITMAASSSYLYTPSTPYGAVMLSLVSNGCAWTTLTLPSGTYKLRGDICNWPCSISGKNLQGIQTTKATVTRSSGDVVSLGTAGGTASSILTTTTWPTAFAVTNNETVTLSLAGQTTTGVGLIDNLVLVPQTNAAIVQNGSFEVSANWTFVYNQSVQPKDAAAYNNLATSNDYGFAIYDGTQRLLLVQTGAAVQDIQIPAPGLYRLVFHAAQRIPLTYGNTYGHNPVRAWLAQGGATNVIGWTRVDDVALVRHEFLFSVTAAGTYRLGLQGMTDNSARFPGTDQNALIDGVSIDPVTDLGDTGFTLPNKLALTVASNAWLQLSYIGTQKVDTVSYAGHYLSGVISQQTAPAFVSGPGALYAAPKGTVITLR
jgi:hypothetical protein